METGNERQFQIEELMAERTNLKERWDTEFAGAAHFVIDQLLAVKPEERRLVLLEVKKSVEQFVKAGERNAVAGSYEKFELSEDLLREIVYRCIARIERVDSLDHERLVDEYKKLDSELSFPKIDDDLIMALDKDHNHPDKNMYLAEVAKISDFIAQVDVVNPKDQKLLTEAIYWPVKGVVRGFRIDEKLKLRIMQDVILNLVERVGQVKSDVEPPQRESSEDWTEVIKNRYLPQLNRTKVGLYTTGNKLEKLRK